MRPPAAKGIIQILVTNRCDRHHCSNCTQLISYRRSWYWMTPANFRRACESLADYPGIVGMFGGNPCLHPQFAELCAIMRDVLPDANRRGLFANHLRGQGAVARETFGYFNLNVHANEDAAVEIAQDLPGRAIYGRGQASWHSPVLLATKDFIQDEAAMWQAIEQCDMNLRWSAAIIERDGVLQAYFCEAASALDATYGEHHGIPVTPGWWQLGIEAFDHQVKRWCPSCGVPLSRRGQLDSAFTDDVSATHADMPGAEGRQRVLHTELPAETSERPTDYLRLWSK